MEIDILLAQLGPIGILVVAAAVMFVAGAVDDIFS